jgi:hypothetical protein
VTLSSGDPREEGGCAVSSSAGRRVGQPWLVLATALAVVWSALRSPARNASKRRRQGTRC